MFERFTADARATVVEAQTYARERGDGAIDTVHLLLALAHQEGGAGALALAAVGVLPATVDRHAAAAAPHDGLDGPALASLGIDLDAIRARTDAAFGTGALERTGRRPSRRGHVPFTKDAKKTLELSLREAIHQGSRSIDSGHVLLALARVEGTTAHRTLVGALADAGSDVERLRAALSPQGRAAS